MSDEPINVSSLRALDHRRVSCKRVLKGVKSVLPVDGGWAEMLATEDGYTISMLGGACFISDAVLKAAAGLAPPADPEEI